MIYYQYFNPASFLNYKILKNINVAITQYLDYTGQIKMSSAEDVPTDMTESGLA